jgi:hypothetical protein
VRQVFELEEAVEGDASGDDAIPAVTSSEESTRLPACVSLVASAERPRAPFAVDVTKLRLEDDLATLRPPAVQILRDPVAGSGVVRGFITHGLACVSQAPVIRQQSSSFERITVKAGVKEMCCSPKRRLSC